MAGYIRTDTTNNISDGNIINASDLDSEFDAIQAAFVNTTGHTHDGTAAEGAPITKIGPTQDFIASATDLKPKTNNALDLGTSGLKFKDIYAAGTAYIATLDLTNALAVADGGTGASTFTANNVLLGNGTSAFQAVAPGTNGNILTSNGTTWTSSALPADIVRTTATQTLTNKTLTDPAMIGTILEDVYTISDGAAFEIDPGNGSVQLITLGANRTPKATNFTAGEAVTLMIDDGSAYTITWTDTTFGGSGVIWKTDNGVAPTLNTTGYTVIVLWKVSTQVYGARVGDA